MCNSINDRKVTANYDKWYLQEVGAGLLSAKANLVVSAEDVEATFSARRDETRKTLCKQYVSTGDVIR